MAHAQSICPMSAPSQRTLRRLFGNSLDLLHEWRRRARGRRELAALCDRCLRDIGATRYDADREVRKPFWRP